MIKIDLNDWSEFSRRSNSVNYFSNDGKYILKASSESHRFTQEEAEAEVEILLTAEACGILTPKLIDIALLPDGSFGLVSERIAEKKSYAFLIGQAPERIDELMKSCAAAAKKFHSCKADTARIPSFTSRLKSTLAAHPIYTDEECAVLLEKAAQLQHGENCLQIDFTPSNIITAGGKNYFIDLGMLSYGDPLFDIGSLWYISNFSSERVYQRVFHTDAAGARRLWKAFAKAYFDSDDIPAIEETVKPYGALSINLMLNTLPNTSFILNNKDFILSAFK